MNGAMQGMMEQHLLNAAKTMEDQIDAKLHELENLGEDDLERIRQKRVHEMKKLQAKKQEWLAKGHGELREITEKEFFAEMKGVARMVCHFYRSSMPCQAMDKHLLHLAKNHLETKFVKVHAEKSPFLTERLKVWMLPTLAIIKNEQTTDYVVGLDELGGTEDFTTETLGQRLAAAGAIFEEEVARPPVGGGEQQNVSNIRKGGQHRTESDEDSDFE